MPIEGLSVGIRQNVSELQRRNWALQERISKLSAAVLRISSSLDLDSVLHEAVDSGCDLTRARCGVVATADQAGRVRDFVTSGFTPEEQQQMAAC